MSWYLKILGTNAAVPISDRYPASQALCTPAGVYLIDCGEGTQSRMAQYGVKRSRINHIFISHLHGDHVFGLPGLLTSYQLYQRKQCLHIFGPPGIAKLITTILEVTKTHLSYELQIHEHDVMVSETILEAKAITVKTLPLDHRIPCCGFLFIEKAAKRRINPLATEKHGVPYHSYASLQDGFDFENTGGHVIPNAELTLPGRKPLSFAYCSDTRYSLSLVEYIKGVDLLYHEATFLSELSSKATQTGHSTAEQAARIAKSADVGTLLMGHFSSRYSDTGAFEAEAGRIFTNSIAAHEGMEIAVRKLE